MKRMILVLFVAALVPVAAIAQSAPASDANPVSTALKQIVAREGEIIVAAFDEMPADKYDFHPTPDQFTYGRMAEHISESNNLLCSRIAGVPQPTVDKLSPTDPKDKLVSAMKASFDFCSQALASVDDSKLTEQIPFMSGRTATRASLMFTLAVDFYDHYSAAAIYLRLNGLLPPTAQPAK